MRNDIVKRNSSRGRWDRRSVLRAFVPLGTLATAVHLGAIDGNDGVSSPRRRRAASPANRAPAEACGLDFQATAYCEFGVTKSGVVVSPGVVAADPKVLPLGSVVYVDVPKYRGVYQVMDAGRLIKGKKIDIYMPGYEQAIEFGRRPAKVTVLRYGYRGSWLGSDG